MHHGHVHVEVVSLLEALPALVAGELQLGLGFVFGHVVLEGRALAALEATDLTPAKGKGAQHQPGAASLGLGQCWGWGRCWEWAFH